MLISAFDHLSAYDFGRDLLIDEIQVSCYKIIESLYTLGTNLGLSRSKKFLRMEINANRARDPIQQSEFQFETGLLPHFSSICTYRYLR